MTKPRAFSYVRFSSARQLDGDSLRRQTEAAREYADRHGLELADLTFRDLGVSAFRGKNAVEGALGAFLAAIEAGKVKPGDYLLVESLDRLSRDRIMAALNRFHDLLQSGVRVVTLMDGQEYDEKSLDNLQGLIVPLAIMSRAHEESLTKSKRGRAAWKRKKKEAAEGHLVTRSVPAWLEVREGKIVANKRKAAVVRRIFDMTLEGHGKQSITHTFNRQGVEPFGRGNGWTESYIRLVLNNAAVIGHYQPMKNTAAGERVPDGEPVEGYFPAVVPEDVFYRVKHRRSGVSGKGKKHPPRNALAGLCRCKKCGGAVHFLNKGSGNLYLQCDAAKRKTGKCDARPLPYWPTFEEVIVALDDFRDYQANNGAVKKRAEKLDALAAEVAELEERADNILDLVESGNKRAGDRFAKLEEKLEEKKAQHRELEEKAIAKDTPPADLEGPVSQYIILAEGAPELVEEEALAKAVRHINTELKRQLEAVLVAKGEPVEFVTKDGTTVTPERKGELEEALEAWRAKMRITWDGKRLQLVPRED